MASIYIVLIPAFALIYGSLENSLKGATGFSDFLYFSTVTITTLGYGDILPISDAAKGVACLQSISGVVIIELFLNSISRSIAEAAKKREKDAQDQLYLRGEIAKLFGIYKIIKPRIDSHVTTICQITRGEKDVRGECDGEFNFQDMKGLFKGSRLLRHNFHVPAIQYYYKELERLTQDLIDHDNGS